jgi:hypothetical protein
MYKATSVPMNLQTGISPGKGFSRKMSVFGRKIV